MQNLVEQYLFKLASNYQTTVKKVRIQSMAEKLVEKFDENTIREICEKAPFEFKFFPSIAEICDYAQRFQSAQEDENIFRSTLPDMCHRCENTGAIIMKRIKPKPGESNFAFKCVCPCGERYMTGLPSLNQSHMNWLTPLKSGVATALQEPKPKGTHHDNY